MTTAPSSWSQLLVVSQRKYLLPSALDRPNPSRRYYFTESPKADTVPVVPFPKGFRMIAGMSSKRAFFGPNPDPQMAEWTDYDRTQQSLMEKSIGFNCLNYAPGRNEGSMQHHYLRKKSFFDANCPDGIRAELQFPSCWDGINLDSKNHTTHVAYPYELRDGDCPEGFPVRLITLFYETIYQTNAFKEYSGQFVFAQGDPTGNGYHGDFINGWEDGVLQQAIYHCTNASGSGRQEDCPVFNIKPDSEVVTCKLNTPEALQGEGINLVAELPGGCQIQSDVDFATMPATMTSMATESSQYATAANTSTSAKAAPSSTTSTAQLPNTTSAVAPSDTPPAPSTPNNGLTTFTSVTTVNGTVMHYVVVEEVVTTTVMVDGAKPTPGATPATPVKRHVHAHSSYSRMTSAHSHGVHAGKKAKRLRGY
jgi:Domain of unknown function (DUF1996)